MGRRAVGLYHVGWLILSVTMMVAHFGGCDGSDDGQSQSPTEHPPNRLVNLKHRRYKSVRDNTTASSAAGPQPPEERLASLPTVIHHDHVHVLPDPHVKSSRNGGFELQKSPPDLQFGLAFTVPFVSLSTEKLIHGVAGKGFGPDSVSSLLKLNFSGLFLAAIVGIVAVAGLLLPSLFGGNGLGGFTGGGPSGWGNGLLDGLIPNQFTDSLYNDYENGWNKQGPSWGKEFGGRNGRKVDVLGAIGRKVLERLRGGFGTLGECALEKVCGEVGGKDGAGAGALTSVIREFKDSGVWGGLEGADGVFKTIRGVVESGGSGCDGGKVKACEGFDNVAEVLRDVVGGGGRGSDKKEE